MPPKRFWKLTLYEWSLCVLQITAKQNRDNANRELAIELWRTFFSHWLTSKDGRPHDPTELARLSYDAAPVEKQKVPADELQKAMEEKFKKRPTRRKRG